MSTVLLVDDDEAVRQVLVEHLGAEGFDVLAAPDTTEALRQLVSHPLIDLCLVDLVMPSDRPDGLAFAQSVRRERPDMPVILMTGYYAAAARVTDPGSNLVYKPIDLDDLVTKIRRMLTHSGGKRPISLGFSAA